MSWYSYCKTTSFNFNSQISSAVRMVFREQLFLMWIILHICKGKTQRKGLSALFYIHEIADLHNWLV